MRLWIFRHCEKAFPPTKQSRGVATIFWIASSRLTRLATTKRGLETHKGITAIIPFRFLLFVLQETQKLFHSREDPPRRPAHGQGRRRGIASSGALFPL